MEIAVAFKIVQVSVDDPPDVMVDGVAVKLEMTGGATTVAVVVAVTVPPALVAVRV
jgi:hypothetical protein